MARLRWLEVTAAAGAVLVLAGACTGGAHQADSKNTTSTSSRFAVTPTREVTIHPPAAGVNGRGRPLGIDGTVIVRIRPSIDGRARVVFSQHDVRGSGPLWAAAGWSAVVAATLTTGAPLGNREIDFDVSGPGGGLEAGALMTVAVIALMRGDAIGPGVTMTGAINPDGAIAPAPEPGILFEVDAAAERHIARMLVPAGQHEVESAAGRPVDLLARGEQKGIRVIETPDIYDAYRVFTGERLPRLPAATTTRLEPGAYAKVRPRVRARGLGRYDAARRNFETVAPSAQQDLGPFARAAARDQEEAKRLGGEGLQAGALSKAINAASLMSATAQVGQSFPTLLSDGPPAFVAQLQAQSPAGGVRDLVDELRSFAPQTVGDAGALVAAYGYAIDALSSARVAQRLFRARAPSPDIGVTWAAQGAVYYELTRALVAAAEETLAAGQGLGGAASGARADQSHLAELFRSAAAANLGAFRASVIPALARAQRSSLIAVEQGVVAADSDFARARSADEVLRALPSYFANSATTDLAQLGGALSLYVRTAGLLSRYTTLGVVDPRSLALTGFANGDAFNSALQVAQDRLASSIGSLRARGVNPLVAAADNEVASVDQNAGVSDQFAALGAYWNGYLSCRVLAYIGGFAEP